MRTILTVIALLAVLLGNQAVLPGAEAGDELLARAPSRFAKLGTNRVHYKVIGKGQTTLVLVHGWSCRMDFWRRQIPELSAKARLVLVDLPGHGRSDAPSDGVTMSAFSLAIDAVLRDAGVRKAVLAGHSMGTPVICRFYRDFPQKTRALIAVDGGLRGFELTAEQRKRFLDRFQAPDYRDRMAEMVKGFFTPGHDTLRDNTIAAMQTTPQTVVVGAMAAMLDRPSWEPTKIEVPLLVLNAPNPMWSEEYVQHVRSLAPQVDYRLVEGAGHFVMLEKPEDFNAAVLDFLGTNKLLRK